MLSVLGIAVQAGADQAGARLAQDQRPDPVGRHHPGLAAGHFDGEDIVAGRHPQRRHRFRLVGHSNLGDGGMNADVWADGGHAYVGVWSGTCPATGVKVVSYSNQHHPRRVLRLQNDPGTSAEDIVVRHVRTPWFSGDLAVTGIQVCDDLGGRVFRGLQFFDVTNPRRPVRLGR